MIVAKHDCAYRMELDRALKGARVEMSAVIELNSLAAVIHCLKEGLGLALLPKRAVAHELEHGLLKQLDWHEAVSAKLFLMRHRDKPLTMAFGAFIATVEKYFAEERARLDGNSVRECSLASAGPAQMS